MVSSGPAAAEIVFTGAVEPSAVLGVLAAHRNQSNVFWGVLVTPVFAFLVVAFKVRKLVVYEVLLDVVRLGVGLMTILVVRLGMRLMTILMVAFFSVVGAVSLLVTVLTVAFLSVVRVVRFVSVLVVVLAATIVLGDAVVGLVLAVCAMLGVVRVSSGVIGVVVSVTTVLCSSDSENCDKG